jgi:flagellar basal body-associated protein FliL
MEIPPLGNSEIQMPAETTPKNGKKIRFLVILVVAVLLLAGVGAVSAAVYLLPFNDVFVRSITKFVPYPAALVNLRPIFFKDFFKEYDALEQFYVTSATPEAEQLSAEERADTILQTMIDHAVIVQLAERYSVKLDETKMNENLQTAYDQSGSEETFFSEINANFGWSKEDFLKHAMEPLILASQVEETVLSDADLQTEARQKIDVALTRLKNNEDFGVVAGEVSEEAQSAASGGDIGHLTTEQMPEQWVSFVKSAELNVPSEAMDLETGYTVVEVTEKSGLEGEEQYNLKVIVVYKRGLDEVKANFMASAKIWKFLDL